MRIAYLLLVHNTPNHLQRLLNALRFEQDDFYLHVDSKSGSSFDRIAGQRIFVGKDRIPVYWGEFSQVEAILILMRLALASEKQYDYFILLSGSDYPLRSPKYIHDYLSKNRGDEFINAIAMPNDILGKPLTRITEYRVGSHRPISRFIYEKLAGLRRLFGGGYFTRDFSKILKGMIPYAGSTWWALTSDACNYAVGFADSRNDFVEFFKNTRCPDEMFLHTVIGNSRYGKRVRHNVTYADWDRFCPPFPAWINEWHIDYFKNNRPLCQSDAYGEAEMLFARKFPDDSQALTRMIDEWIWSDDEQ